MANTDETFSDWDDIESHKTFVATPGYGPFVAKLKEIISDLKIFHLKPSPAAPTVLNQGLVEMGTFFDVDEKFNGNVRKFLEAVKGAGVSLGTAHGQVIEDISKEEDGKKARAVVLFIGWESVSKHMEFRETDTFKEHIYLLRKGVNGGVELVRFLSLKLVIFADMGACTCSTTLCSRSFEYECA